MARANDPPGDTTNAAHGRAAVQSHEYIERGNDNICRQASRSAPEPLYKCLPYKEIVERMSIFGLTTRALDGVNRHLARWVNRLCRSLRLYKRTRTGMVHILL